MVASAIGLITWLACLVVVTVTSVVVVDASGGGGAASLVARLDAAQLLKILSCDESEYWILRLRSESCVLDSPAGTCAPAVTPATEKLMHTLRRQDDMFRAVAVQAAEDHGIGLIRFGDVVLTPEQSGDVLGTVMQHALGVSFAPLLEDATPSRVINQSTGLQQQSLMTDANAAENKLEDRRLAAHHHMTYFLVGPNVAVSKALFRSSSLPAPLMLQEMDHSLRLARPLRQNTSHASALRIAMDRRERGSPWTLAAGPGGVCNAAEVTVPWDPLDEGLLALVRKQLKKKPTTAQLETMPQSQRAVLLRRAVLAGAVLHSLPHLLPAVRNTHGVHVVDHQAVAVHCDKTVCLQQVISERGGRESARRGQDHTHLRSRRIVIAVLPPHSNRPVDDAAVRAAWTLYGLVTLRPYSSLVRLVYSLDPDSELVASVLNSSSPIAVPDWTKTLMRLVIMPLNEVVPDIPSHVAVPPPKAVVDIFSIEQVRSTFDRYLPRVGEGKRRQEEEQSGTVAARVAESEEADQMRKELVEYVRSPLRHLRSSATWLSHVVGATHAVTALFILPPRKGSNQKKPTMEDGAWAAARGVAAEFLPIRSKSKLNVFYVEHPADGTPARRPAPITFDDHVVDVLSATCNISSWPTVVLLSPISTSDTQPDKKAKNKRQTTKQARPAAGEGQRKHLLVFEAAQGSPHKRHASKSFSAVNIAKAIRSVSSAVLRGKSNGSVAVDGLRYIGTVTNAKLQAAVRTAPRDQEDGFLNVERWPAPPVASQAADEWGFSVPMEETKPTGDQKGKGTKQRSDGEPLQKVKAKKMQRQRDGAASHSADADDTGASTAVPEPVRHKPRRHSPIVQLEVGWEGLRIYGKQGGAKKTAVKKYIPPTLGHVADSSEVEVVWMEDG